MAISRAPDIYMDLDRERILSMIDAAYDHISEFLGLPALTKTKESIMLEAKTILDSSRVSTQFYLDFSSQKMNDLRVRVDPRRRELLGISPRFEKNKNHINRFLRAL